MADKHTYDVTIGNDTYTVESDHPLSDADAYAYAKAQVPFDVKAQNATMRANMGKQPTEAELQARAVSEPWTGAAIGERAVAGARGVAKGFAGGLAAPALLLGHAMRHPIDASEEAGNAALALGAAGAQAVAHPLDTYRAVKPAMLRLAADPESIGMAVGGLDAALATPALIGAAKNTRVGQAVAAGVSDAANKVPGVAAARAALASSKPAPALSLSSVSKPPLSGLERLPVPVSVAPELEAVSNAGETLKAPDLTARLRERLGLETPLPESPDVAIPERGPAGPDPQGTGSIRTVDQPGHVQDALMAEYGMPVTDAAAGSARTPDPVFAQVGGRGAEAGTAEYGFEWPEVGTQYKLTSGPRAGSHVGADTLRELGIPVPEKPVGGVTAAQARATARAAEETGASTEEARKAFELMFPNASPEEIQSLIGSRKAGSMRLADRTKLMAELLKRQQEAR